MAQGKQSVERIKEILSEAKDIKAGSARAEFLKRACGNEVQLRTEVESLLEAYDSTCDFLSRDATGEVLQDSPDLIDTMIDHYRLIELVGVGGFGNVYRAEQIEPLHREVALKIIKLGMDTKQVVARFEAERQALARMNHPGIAQVYDAGATKTGRPYFVMELVRGIPIIEYCDRHRLSMPDRIELFRQVCDAVQHAHQKGILHRDLKPSNILVSDENGKSLAKVIDFGIAKSLEGRLTKETLVTLQEMLIGTPMYMSPEQLSQDPSEIDARSDIYSLGVILYELVAGTTPLEHKTPTSLTVAGMRQSLANEELPRPSRRFHSLGKRTTVIADRRQIKPPTLERLLRGDLDWVVMKAIEKERDRRYDDVIALSEELERYLKHEPVAAGPPRFSRRTKKFMTRHRSAFAVGASVVISLLAGFGLRYMMQVENVHRDLQHTREQSIASEAGSHDAPLQFLGMTLKTPTDELNKRYGFTDSELPGPVITKLTKQASSYWKHPPYEGCSFYIVMHPAHGFIYNKESSPRYYPYTVRQLMEAIVACSASPEEYQKIKDDTHERCRRQAEILKNDLEKRDRLLRMVESKMPKEDRGMYICRVVYRYPKRRMTMTTHLRMTDHDFNQLRELLQK